MAKYGKDARKTIGDTMHEYKHGDLTIGKSDKKVKNPKQAQAIGIERAREKDQKVPGRSESS